MKKQLLARLISGTALACGLAAAPDAAVRAEENWNHAQGHGTIEGTWVATVPSGSTQATPFLSMATHTPTGQAFEENNTPQVRSVAQGEWMRTGHRHFFRTLLFINFQPLTATQGARVYAGVTRVQSEITLDTGGNSYVAVSKFEVYDANGTLVNSGQNTAQARRCGLGDSIPFCLGLMR